MKNKLRISLILMAVMSLEQTPAAQTRTVLPHAVESPLNFGLEIKYHAVKYNRYQFNDSTRNNRTGHGFHIAFEWLPIQNFGKVGIGAATAGTFGISNVEVGGGKMASLRVLPIEAFVSYRFEFRRRQMVVPYGKFGGSVAWVRQTSATGAEIPGTRISYGRDFAVGIEISLSRLDPTANLQLDRTVGINSTYLVAEYAKSSFVGSSGAPDVSHESYRVGLRFEL